MLVEAVLIPLLIGKLRGGKFKNILNIEVKLWWLVTVAGLIEFVASWIRARELGSVWIFIDANILWIHVVSYGLLIAVLLLNRFQKGFILLLIGTILNFTVIAANDGRMPVEIESVEHMMSADTVEALKTGSDLTHTVLTDSTKLKLLGDIIHLPKPYPLPKSLSVGDLLIIAGVFVIIQGLMISTKKEDIKTLDQADSKFS